MVCNDCGQYHSKPTNFCICCEKDLREYDFVNGEYINV